MAEETQKPKALLGVIPPVKDVLADLAAKAATTKLVDRTKHVTARLVNGSWQLELEGSPEQPITNREIGLLTRTLIARHADYLRNYRKQQKLTEGK